MLYQQITPTKLKGVYLIEPKYFVDARGWYCPQMEVAELERGIGVKLNIVQESESFNFQKGVLRGIHYQKPNTQGKLVRVISGRVLDVAVDLYKDSPTFGRYIAYELSSDNHYQLWIPPGFAHGFITLEDNTRFSYIVTDGIYDKLSEKGINPLDSDIGIDWKIPQNEMIILPRDLSYPNLKDVPEFHLF